MAAKGKTVPSVEDRGFRDPRNLSSIVKEYSDGNKTRKYKGLFYNHTNNSLLVADIDNGELCKVDLHQQCIVPFVKLNNPGKALNGIAVTSEGLIAVSDYYKCNIQLYSADDQPMFIRNFTDYPLKGVNGIATNESGELFAAQSNEKNVVVFDKNGTFMHKFGKAPGANQKPVDGHFKWPYQVCTPPDGLVYISDTQGSCVQVFHPDGTHVRNIGAGVVSGSSGIAFTPDGYLVVASNGGQNVWFYTANGRLVHNIKGYGVSESHGVAVNDVGSIFVADVGKKRVVQL